MPPFPRRLLFSLASLLLFAALPVAAAIDESDLLPVDQAYVLSAEATAAEIGRAHV